MRAVFTVEVPDDFMAERAREYDHDRDEAQPTDPAEYFSERCREIADDDLPIAFFGWPVDVTVEVPS
jgi:hypothetical protein